MLLYLPDDILERMERVISDYGEIPGKGVMGYFFRAARMESCPYLEKHIIFSGGNH